MTGEAEPRIFKLETEVQPDFDLNSVDVSGLEEVDTANSDFFQGVIRAAKLKESNSGSKTIEQIREENGLAQREMSLQDAQEEWLRQGHG